MVDVTKNAGDNVLARIMVTNTGTATGIWTVSFAIEGTVSYGSEDYRIITLAPGETLPVEWNFTAPEREASAGQYVIYWDEGTKFYPAVLPNFVGTNYNLIISGVAVLQITNPELI